MAARDKPCDNVTNLSSSSVTSVMANKVMAGASNLVKMLPTGTVMVFQMLSPLVTNNGQCHLVSKYLTGFLLFFCGLSCAFSTFTDSFVGSNGKITYGIVTPKGLYVFGGDEDGGRDLSAYKLRAGDFVHAIISVLVLATVALLDRNTAGCYYAAVQTEEKVLNMVLPPVVGSIASFIFLLFPNKRHSIGYTSITSGV